MEVRKIRDWDEIERDYQHLFPKTPKDRVEEITLPKREPRPVQREEPILWGDVPERVEKPKVREQREPLTSRMYRAIAQWKNKKIALFQVLVIVLCAAVVVGGAVYLLVRQDQIDKSSFKTDTLEAEMSQMAQTIKTLQEQLKNQTNEMSFKEEAMENYGLQDPSKNQIVYVDMEGQDRLINNNPSDYYSESDMETAKTNLASYFWNIETMDR